MGVGIVKWILTGVLLLGMFFNVQLCQAMSPEQYIESIAPYAQRVKEYGLFPSVAIAQSCRETGFGRHLDAQDIYGRSVREYNNVLGKKWRNGRYFEKVTPEGYGAGRYMAVGKFQAYDSIQECFEDYAVNLSRNSAYKYKDTSNVYNFVHSIAHRYATDNPWAYADGVLRIIEKYNLTKYD
ncbi:MAG: N-acetylmuramidase [Firmicutes bacterium]|nr:N-acetylmuramidase [Bacillota bacterium]